MADNFDGWEDEEQTDSSAVNDKPDNSSNTRYRRRQENKGRIYDEPIHHDYDLGEAPDFPSVFFTYDDKTQILEIRDRRGKIKQQVPVVTVKGTNGEGAYETWKKGQEGADDISIEAFLKSMQGKVGKNGKNAYEEWKDSRDPNTDRSWEAYLKFFTGDKGESAFEQWQQVHGEYTNPTIDDFFNYLKGQNGKDAYEVWQDMGFKDRSREDFFKWIASLVETQKGEDGRIYYPHFDGHVIYFTEDVDGKGPRFIEKDIRGKDGRTFDPVFEGTKLHFEDGEGTSTDPVELKGKDAFELWKEYHHKPDAKYEEFEEYFKGQNVLSSHSYMEVKDWRCPVQKIDTDLIVNSLRPAKSPQSFIKERQNAIKDLRGKGNEPKRRANWFKEFTWWCAGADKGLLRMCPGDHSKYTGIGTVILFTALMAWISSFIAIKLVFGTTDIYLPSKWQGLINLIGKDTLHIPIAAMIFATFWALMIFFLDRFITNTMYSDGEVTISKQEFLSGLPRILIAIFLGIVISAPLELKIFSKEITEYIKNDQNSKIEYKVVRNQAYIDTCRIYNSLSDKADDAYKLWNNVKQEDYTKPINLESKTPFGAVTDTLTGDTTAVLYAIKSEPTFVDDTSRFNTEKSKAWNYYQECLEKVEEYEKVKSATYRKVESDIKALYNKIDSIGLYERLNALHALAMKVGQEDGYKPLFPSIDRDTLLALNATKRPVQNIIEAKDTTTLNSSNVVSKKQSVHVYPSNIKDLIFKLVLSAICIAFFILIIVRKEKEKEKELEDKQYANNKGLKIAVGVLLSIIFGSLIGCNYELIHYLIYYLTTPIGLIMLLFILIDISPVLYKMMLADGVYDKYLQQEKILVQDTIRLNNAQMLRQIEKGELKSVSPFIMGELYDELVSTAINKPQKDDKGATSNVCDDKKKHVGWEDGDSSYNLEGDIERFNKEVFDKVVDYKKRIVLASYAAWYRDMRDSMIGKKDDAKGADINPESAFKGDDWS